MASSRRKADRNNDPPSTGREKLRKFYPLVAGNTMNSHERLVRKLVKHGARTVDSADKSDVVLIFCPVVSRLETDINAALDEATVDGSKVILVAMHHTHKTDYTVPPLREHRHNGQSVPVVHCLFQENKGLLRCPTNKQAAKSIRKQMGIKKYRDRCVTH